MKIYLRGLIKKSAHDKTISHLIYVLLRIIPNNEIKEWQEHITQIHRMFPKGK